MRWRGFRKVRRQVGKRIGRRLVEIGLADLAAYRARLEAGLRSINPAPGVIRTVPKPVLGAIRIGQKLLNS